MGIADKDRLMVEEGGGVEAGPPAWPQQLTFSYLLFFWWRSEQPGQMFAGGGSRGAFLFLQKQRGQQLVNEWVRRPDEQSVYISHSHLASARNLYLRRRNPPFFTLFVSPSSSRHLIHLQLIKSQPGRWGQPAIGLWA